MKYVSSARIETERYTALYEIFSNIPYRYFFIFVNMEIKYLKLIKTIAEEGSIANSSAKLFLTQSALSHQLRELEAYVGFKVFHRTRNKWELSEEGNELYKVACKVIESIETGLEKITHIRSGAIGKIKVSTECYSFYKGLPAFIQKMGILYPEIEVDLILEATHQPIPKILSNEIDIAVVTSRPDEEQLISFEIFEDEVFAVLHRENPFSNLNYLDTNKFSEIHLIIHSYPLETVSVYEQYLKPNNITPLKISAIPLTEIALEMVQANIGIICMPKWALKSFMLSDELIFKRIGKYGFKRTHYLVVRKSDMSKKYISDFILNFEEYFQKEV